MNVYYINLILILGLAYPLCIRKPSKAKKAAYLAIIFGWMWFLATFRLNIGFDYQNYLNIFETIRWKPTVKDVLDLPFEPGYSLFTRFLSSFVDESTAFANPVWVYGIYSFFIFVPIALSIYWYCNNAWLSTWLYVMLTYFYSSMSFIRANLSLGFVLMGYKFLRDRKPIPYFLIVLLGATFHYTALVMIPIYFLSMIPINWKTLLFYGGVITATYLLSPLIVDIVTNYIYTAYKDTIYIENGFSAIFLLIPSVLLVACLALFPVWKQRDPSANMLLSMAIYSWGIWLLITRHFIIERLSHYPYMLMIIAIPAALQALYAPQKDYDKLAALELQSHERKGKGTKSEMAEIRTLRQKISDHKKYYWSAVAALLLITFLYHEFGQYVNGENGFHAVFPYQSVIPWLNG